MKQEELLFLHALDASLHPDRPATKAAVDITKWQAALPQLLTLSREHKILPPVYEFLCEHGIKIPNEQMPALTSEIATYVLSCHQMKYFSDYLCKLFDDAGLPYALLKGTILSRLYPKAEYRRYGDVDILINDSASFQKATELLLHAGFQQVPSSSDHHLEFLLTKGGHAYTLELHQHITHSHDRLALYDAINHLFDTISLASPLSFTFEALYLLLHMLKHLLNSGFGIKLLCDWVVYLEAYGAAIDNNELKRILEELNLTTFAWGITSFCRRYLGLQAIPDCLSFELSANKTREIIETLAEDIFAGGEYGYSDSSRMIIMKNSSHLMDYCRELHRQTGRNYPAASKLFLILPILWLLTGIRFLYNNHHVRHQSTRQIISTTRKRQNLLRTLKIKL